METNPTPDPERRGTLFVPAEAASGCQMCGAIYQRAGALRYIMHGRHCPASAVQGARLERRVVKVFDSDWLKPVRPTLSERLHAWWTRLLKPVTTRKPQGPYR